VYVPVDLTIPTKLGSSGLDSLDLLSRLTARTIFSAAGQGCIKPPARYAREIQTIPTNRDTYLWLNELPCRGRRWSCGVPEKSLILGCFGMLLKLISVVDFYILP
jgi:hypothetical protein